MYLVHIFGKGTRNYNEETEIGLERFFSQYLIRMEPSNTHFDHFLS